MMSEAETKFLAAMADHRKTSNNFTLTGPNRRAAQNVPFPEIFEITRVPRFEYTPQFVVSHPRAINWLAIALSILLNASKIKSWMFKSEYFGYFKLQIEDSNAHKVIYRLIERSYSASEIGNKEEIDTYIDTIQLPQPNKILYDLAKNLKISEGYLYAFGVLATQASSLTERLGLSKTPKLLMESIDAHYASTMFEEDAWIILGKRPASTTGSTFIEFDYDDTIFDQEKEEEEEEEEELAYERRRAMESRTKMILQAEDSGQDDGFQEDGVQEEQDGGVQEEKDGVQEEKDGVQEEKDGVQEEKDGVQEEDDSRFVSIPWWDGVKEGGVQEEDRKKRPREVIDLTGEDPVDQKDPVVKERKKPREVIDLTGDDDE
jgi:hypothetical protein